MALSAAMAEYARKRPQGSCGALRREDPLGERLSKVAQAKGTAHIISKMH